MQIFAEEYRPKTIDECVLTEEVKAMFKGLIQQDNIPSMLFVGSAGCGKTTVARAIANELEADLLFINASLDANLDNIRTKITNFASTVSFTSSSKKITILDEADGMTLVQQQALRGFIEAFSKNHIIIFTANNLNKIIEPIQSRCKVVNFKIANTDKKTLQAKFLKRVFNILDKENIEYEKEAVIELVFKKFPDFRSVLNELQGYAAGGKIDSGILTAFNDGVFTALINALKNKKFNDCRRWVGEYSDMESTQFFRMFYDTASEKLEPQSIPELILALGEFSYKDAFVADTELNRAAFVTTILLANLKWK